MCKLGAGVMTGLFFILGVSVGRSSFFLLT